MANVSIQIKITIYRYFSPILQTLAVKPNHSVFCFCALDFIAVSPPFKG